MTGHGPDAETFEKASRADLSKPDVIADTMAFMFETPAGLAADAAGARIAPSCRTTTSAAGRGCASTSTRPGASAKRAARRQRAGRTRQKNIFGSQSTSDGM